MDKRIKNALGGKSYKQGGLNITHLRKIFIERFPCEKVPTLRGKLLECLSSENLSPTKKLNNGSTWRKVPQTRGYNVSDLKKRSQNLLECLGNNCWISYTLGNM